MTIHCENCDCPNDVETTNESWACRNCGKEHESPAGQPSAAPLLAIASEWRRDAAMHRGSCRLHEAQNDRQRADRHYQRSLDLDACAKRIEDLANVRTEPRGTVANDNPKSL